MTLLMGPRVEGWRLDAITPDGEHIATLPLIRDSGRTRATASGRQAVVWIAV